MSFVGSADFTRRGLFAVAALAYVLALEWTYRTLMVKLFAYQGVRLQSLDYLTTCASVLVALLPVLWLPTVWRRPSDVALIYLYVQLVVPIALFSPHLTSGAPERMVLYSLLLLLSLGVVQIVRLLPFPELPVLIIPSSLIIAVIVLSTLLLSAYAAKLADFHFDLSIADVYIRRLEARDTLTTHPIGRYGIAILTAALIPVGLALGFSGRSFTALCGSCLGILAVFSFTGQKSVGLTPVLLAGLWVMWRFGRNWFAIAIMLIAAAVTTAASVLYFAMGSSTLIALFTWRMLVAAARNHVYYLEFFATNPLYLFGGGRLHGIIDTPYHQPMSMMLGRVYSPVLGMNLNSNAWASGYGDLGFLGMLVVALPIGLVLWCMDAASVRLKDAFAYLLAGFLAFIFAEQAFSTSLFSGGVVTTVLLVCLLALTSRADPHT